MVRVISVHHFSRQDVSLVGAAPTALSSAGANTVVLADGRNQTMQVRDLEGGAGGRVGHTFQTIDVVREVVYCPTGKYLLTLEGGAAPDGVRVYVNWADPAVGKAPICPRIAGCVSPTYASQSSSDEDGGGGRVILDVIEFPQRDSPLHVAACSTTGNIMVAAANFLAVYKYVNKNGGGNGASKDKGGSRGYIDFKECIQVFHNLVPTEVALSEDVIACMSDSELHVFKVKMKEVTDNDEDDDDERNLHSISLYSFNSTDLDSSGNGSGQQQQASFRLGRVAGPPEAEAEEGDDDGVGSGEKRNCPPPPLRNVSARRQQDSESNGGNGGFGDGGLSPSSSGRHLPGYDGYVRLHPRHVDLSSADAAVPVIHLREVEEANKRARRGGGVEGDRSSSSQPKLVEHTFGPLVGATETTIKLIGNPSPSHLSPEEDHQSIREDCYEMECVTLLRCSLSDSEHQRGERLRNLNLKPVFWREYRVRSKAASSVPFPLPHPLQSSLHPHLMSLTACFTSQSEGHLYHLPGHLRRPGKGCGVHKVTTYPFTSAVSKIALEPTMLHALTETGLESYTLKSGYSTILEAEKVDGLINACPPGGGGSEGPDDDEEEANPVCLVGLRPFLGAKHLLVSQSHLVLLSRPDDEQQGQLHRQEQEEDSSQPPQHQDEWTMYSLTLPTPTELHRDMLQLACLNRSSSPQGYFQLLCEAHMVLRTSLRQLSWQQAVGANGAKEKYAQTRKKYLETCHLLGLHYALSRDRRRFPLAVPYFRMSGRPAVACLHSCLEEHFRGGGAGAGASVHLPPGLVSYVEEIVLRPSAPSENVLDAGLADAVIDLLGRHSHRTLAGLVLRSRGFREFKTKKTRKALWEAKTASDSKSSRGEETPPPSTSPEIVLALCFLTLDDDEDREQALHLLLRLPASQQVSLAAALIEHHHLLFEKRQESAPEVTGFSDLAVLFQDCVPEMFVEVLVSLVLGGAIGLKSVLSLFLSALATASSAVDASHERINSATAALQLFLETYFTEVLADSEQHQQQQGEDDPCDGEILEAAQTEEGEEALQTLVRSYLASLSVPVHFGEKNIDADMFGNRLLCLDKLPPFQESAKEVLDASSPEFWCQNSLLKLQSLLSCPQLATAPVKDTVLHFLDNVGSSSSSSSVVGELSLRLLCCRSHSEVVSLLCSSPHPAVLLGFAKEIPEPFSEDHWRLAVHSLQDRLAGSDDDHPLHETWYSAQQELLDHLAQELSLVEFLRVLPGTGEDEEFQGYIQMCRKNQQAVDIQNLIVNTGQKLLATLNF